MKSNKSQAAMEFLMTYGWAILIVLIAIGALAYFGVLIPDRYLSEWAQEARTLGEDCNELDKTMSKIACVNRYWQDQNLSDSQDCSDATDFYAVALSQLDGVSHESVLPNHTNHIFLIVSFKNTYCILDQEYLNCIKLKDDSSR